MSIVVTALLEQSQHCCMLVMPWTVRARCTALPVQGVRAVKREVLHDDNPKGGVGILKLALRVGRIPKLHRVPTRWHRYHVPTARIRISGSLAAPTSIDVGMRCGSLFALSLSFVVGMRRAAGSEKWFLSDLLILQSSLPVENLMGTLVASGGSRLMLHARKPGQEEDRPHRRHSPLLRVEDAEQSSAATNRHLPEENSPSP